MTKENISLELLNCECTFVSTPFIIRVFRIDKWNFLQVLCDKNGCVTLDITHVDFDICEKRERLIELITRASTSTRFMKHGYIDV